MATGSCALPTAAHSKFRAGMAAGFGNGFVSRADGIVEEAAS